MNQSRRKLAGLRRHGRRLALQLLYAFEQKRYLDDGMLGVEEFHRDLDPEALAFGRELFALFCANRTPIDALVDGCLNNWTLGRLAILDRSVLRLGSAELLYREDTPPKVVINEYIELTKRFGSERRTTGLVNGVLDRIAREHRPA
ncbi:MAG: transcription antitermination factor NusB [Planctomycetota bacterium]